MAKLAVLLLAGFAYHAVLAGAAGNQQSPWIRGLVKQIQDNTNDAVSSIQSAQIDSNQAKRALKFQANEWIHRIENAVLLSQQAVLQNQGGAGQQTLVQVADRLCAIVRSIRTALIGDASQLKDKLITNLQDVASEAEKLGEVAQQQDQKRKENQDNISKDLEEILEDILDATRQLKLRRKLQVQNQQQIKDQIQQAANEVASAVDKITSKDQDAAREMAHQIQELSHNMDRIIHRLRREVNHRGGEGKTVMEEVANKLSEIRASVDQAVNSQGRNNAEAWISEMKNKLKVNIKNAADQLEKLVQLLQTGNESNQATQDVNNLVRNVIADGLSEARRLKWQLENIDESN